MLNAVSVSFTKFIWFANYTSIIVRIWTIHMCVCFSRLFYSKLHEWMLDISVDGTTPQKKTSLSKSSDIFHNFESGIVSGQDKYISLDSGLITSSNLLYLSFSHPSISLGPDIRSLWVSKLHFFFSKKHMKIHLKF